MEKKIHFEMKLSHDDDTEFEVYGKVKENMIEFNDINNVVNRFTIHDKKVVLERGTGTQTFVAGEKTSTEYFYKEGLVLNVDVFTEDIFYDGEVLQIKFENYINGNFTNKHELTLMVLN